MQLIVVVVSSAISARPLAIQGSVLHVRFVMSARPLVIQASVLHVRFVMSARSVIQLSVLLVKFVMLLNCAMCAILVCYAILAIILIYYMNKSSK